MKSKLPNKGLKILALSPKYHKAYQKPNIVFTFNKKEDGSIEILDAFEEDFSGKVRIYEDRVKGWFLNFAKELSKRAHSGFVVLMLCVSYLEGNQQFREGKESKNQSGEMIKKAISRMMKIPKANEKLFDLFIKEVRCGLFHDGMTRKHILIKDDISHAILIDEKNEILIISPSKLLELVEIDLELYIRDLTNTSNKQVRENFEKFWKLKYE